RAACYGRQELPIVGAGRRSTQRPQGDARFFDRGTDSTAPAPSAVAVLRLEQVAARAVTTIGSARLVRRQSCLQSGQHSRRAVDRIVLGGRVFVAEPEWNPTPVGTLNGS